MPGGRCSRIDELNDEMRALLGDARRGVLSTIGENGTPHTVPVCYAVRDAELVIPIDDKPKGTSELTRLGNIRANPAVAFLADRWDEDWTRLAWVMVRGIARFESPGFASDALRAKYEQYRSMELDGPVIVIEPEIINWWSWT